MEFLLLLVLLSSSLSAGLAAKSFTFNVDYQNIAPDCVTKRVAVVNGQYPGPALSARSGETISVLVNNRLREGLTIHWHGLHQKGRDAWQDGGAFGSQCPIPPGGSYTYTFTTAGQWGTFWWHAHIGLLRTTVHGPLVIRAPKDQPEPFPTPFRTYFIMVNDWYYKSNDELLKGLDQVNTPYAPFGKPDTLHLNGRGRTNCGSYNRACRSKGPCLPCNNVPACNKLGTFTVVQGRTYRFRLVNIGLFGSINIQFQGHSFTIVEADGNYVKPVSRTSIDILPGEAYSVLLTANQRPGNYWVAANGRFDSNGVSPGVGVLRYRSVLWAVPPGPVPGAPRNDPVAQQNSLKALRPGNIQRLNPTTKLTLRWGVHQVAGKFLYSVNNVSYAPPDMPMQYADWSNTRGVFDTSIMSPHGVSLPGYAGTPCKVGTSALDVPLNSVVQIVLQNNAPPGLEHPWHLHGYDFWVVGGGSGVYDPNRESSYRFNLYDPPLRNTVNVHDNQWVAIRFVANNPGMRQIHCHLEPHVHLGMQTFLRIHDPSLPGPPANYIRSCPGYNPKPARTPTPVRDPGGGHVTVPRGGNLNFDWSAIGEVAQVNVILGSSVTFLYGQSDSQDHSITPLSPSSGLPGVDDSCFTATQRLLQAISNKDGIAMTLNQKSRPSVQPPGFRKVIVFNDLGTFAFTCSMHTGTQNLIVEVTRTALPKSPPPHLSPPATFRGSPPAGGGSCPTSGPRASWTTQQSDMARTGWQPNEFSLTPSNVRGGAFRKINARAVDGQVYAQPLVASGVRLPNGQTVDLVIVATETNWIYAFNADRRSFSVVWSINVGTPVNPPGGCFDLTPHIGITSTPVISGSTLYVVAKAQEGPTPQFRLHAINLANGAKRSSSPISTSYNYNGASITFNARIHHQRSALALSSGTVWIAFSSHCDFDDYHGWLIGMSTSTLSVVKQYSTTTTHRGWGAIWMSGQGPAVSNGYLYASTGNGRVDGGDMSQSIIKVDLRSGPNMKLADYFRPTYPTSRTYGGDTDLGSGGVVLIQDQPGGELLAQAGKARVLYSIQTGNMRKDCNPCSSEDAHAHQHTWLEGGAVFSSGAYWPRKSGSFFYIHNGAGYSGKGLAQFSVRNGQMTSTGTFGERTNLANGRGTTPSISSAGPCNGIVWEVGKSGNNAMLLAYDAVNLQLIYNSNDHGDWLGGYNKFQTPVIANGFVYVAYNGGIAQFGLV